jgi:hypothetical protein
MHENAEKYLRDVLKGGSTRKTTADYEMENGARYAERRKGKLYQEYSALKNEICEVEIIRKAAEQTARQIGPPKWARAREMELQREWREKSPPFDRL